MSQDNRALYHHKLYLLKMCKGRKKKNRKEHTSVCEVWSACVNSVNMNLSKNLNKMHNSMKYCKVVFTSMEFGVKILEFQWFPPLPNYSSLVS